MAKAVLKGKFIALKAYLKKQEKAQINILSLYLNEVEKEQIKPKVSRRKEIIKIRVKINKWDYIKLKRFCIEKETINKMKGQTTKWENIFVNDTCDMELNPKFIKNL